MTDDKIEAWLKECEEVDTSLGLLKDNIALAIRLATNVPKLLSLVRVYREANQFYAGLHKFHEEVREPIRKGGCPIFVIDDGLDPIGNRARAAEAKAEEIVGK